MILLARLNLWQILSTMKVIPFHVKKDYVKGAKLC